MADVISFDELQLKMDRLKEQIATDLPNSKLACIYCDTIDSFLLFCKQDSSCSPVDNVPKYFELVTGVHPYMRPVTECKMRKARAVLFVRDTLDGKDIARKYCYDTVTIPESFQQDLQLYNEWQASKGCSTSTISTRIGRLKPFFTFIFKSRCFSIDDLDAQTFVNFIGTLDSQYNSASKTNILYTLRSYFLCPMIRQKLQFNPDFFLENLHTNKHERLESFYSAEEIRSVLASVNRSSKQGKMMYVMMLLASVYGLRSCDIRTLQLSNLDWKNQRIRLSQQKTRRYLELPLTTEVSLALLDYIKNARPDTVNTHILFAKDHPKCRIRTITTFQAKYMPTSRKPESIQTGSMPDFTP